MDENVEKNCSKCDKNSQKYENVQKSNGKNVKIFWWNPKICGNSENHL